MGRSFHIVDLLADKRGQADTFGMRKELVDSTRPQCEPVVSASTTAFVSFPQVVPYARRRKDVCQEHQAAHRRPMRAPEATLAVRNWDVEYCSRDHKGRQQCFRNWRWQEEETRSRPGKRLRRSPDRPLTGEKVTAVDATDQGRQDEPDLAFLGTSQ